MPTWLSDPSNEFYLVLFVMVVVTVTMWARNRTRGNRVRAAVAVGLLVLVFVIDRMFQSPREESIGRVEEISAAINERNWDKFQANLSDSFEYKGKKKAEFTELVRKAVATFNPVTTSWEHKAPDDLKPGGPDELLIQFEGKATVSGKPLMLHFVATFVKDPDGRWRLKSFKPYD